MAPKSAKPAKKPATKTKTRSSRSSSSSKTQRPAANSFSKQHKPRPLTATKSKTKKPPHLRYTEKELRVPSLNGIRPAGVKKLPNQKKGKTFVDDGEGMRTILAMVMAEKEGNIESKMMRARQLEEIREAKRVEAEERAQKKRAGLDEKKEAMKHGKRSRNSRSDSSNQDELKDTGRSYSRGVKRVSFG